MLKIDDENILKNFENKNFENIKINFNNEIINLYYDGSANKEVMLEKLEKEELRLTSSIERRKKLLSNENYVNKAPSNLVENEKNTLEKEIKELETIILKKKEISE